MNIEKILVSNFRSFGPLVTSIEMDPELTAVVGANGSGKTALMQVLQRMFGVSNEQRTIRRQDFHVPALEKIPPSKRTMYLEAIIAFPELDDDTADHSSIPSFFHHLSITDSDGKLKCRLRLEAEWEDDGSIDGYITSKYHAITAFGKYEEEDIRRIQPSDRSRIQLIYIPATRSASTQVSAFLKGRLWKAVNWSKQVRTSFLEQATVLNSAFESEEAIGAVTKKLTTRWQELHSAGTNSTPKFRPVDLRFEEFVRKVEVLLHPDENNRDRSIEELSDGQSSLFHIAMIAATLDIENDILNNADRKDFHGTDLALPSLTILALEEPENNLAPYYLSRIVSQLNSLVTVGRTQAILSSHSPSILARVNPLQVRHFRIENFSNTTLVNKLTLPENDIEASKYIQQAVRAFPELYFAKVVILGEGASEEIIIPAIAEAMGTPIDKSFVAMVPLGGRHVNHMWRLLTELNIPFFTLLDLDWGRFGGGWGRIKNVASNLIKYGYKPEEIFENVNPNGYQHDLDFLGKRTPSDITNITDWSQFLRSKNVFFSHPLDIDYSMLKAFPLYYQIPPDADSKGPSSSGLPSDAVLGENGNPNYYSHDIDSLRWYRYLFLGRGKPSTHMRVIGVIPPEQLAEKAPEELKALLTSVIAILKK
jgi:putative ATP-dependent endonuclease of OLD family